MRNAAIGVSLAVAVAAMSAAWGGKANPANAQENLSAIGSGLIALSSVADNQQQIAVIDPQQRVMSIYHVDLTSGKIELKSVRNITWDLQIEQFNSAEPLPEQIRSLLNSS